MGETDVTVGSNGYAVRAYIYHVDEGVYVGINLPGRMPPIEVSLSIARNIVAALNVLEMRSFHCKSCNKAWSL
jgi:hypothetical protein